MNDVIELLIESWTVERIELGFGEVGTLMTFFVGENKFGCVLRGLSESFLNISRNGILADNGDDPEERAYKLVFAPGAFDLFEADVRASFEVPEEEDYSPSLADLGIKHEDLY